MVVKAQYIELKFTRIAGCTGTSDNLEVIHDYGKITISWDDILYVFAAKIRGLEGQEIPILLFLIRDQEGFFYVDGVKISPRFFSFDESTGEMLEK